MGVGEVIGGVAVLGTAVLIGLALTADDSPETITSATPVALGPDSSDAVATTPPATEPTVTAAATTPTASPGTSATTAQDPVDETISSSPAASTTTTTERPSTTTTTEGPAATTSTTEATVPEAQRPVVGVQVVNAGVEAGAAAFVTGVLKQSGFEPLEPRDAAAGVDAVTIYYAPGRRAEALTVNSIIEADPDRVTTPPVGDANWSAFGSELDVLVLLGPPTQ